MIVECPNCKTTFNVDDDLVPEAGIKSRCSVCEHVFPIKPGGAAAEPAAPAASDDDFGDDDLGIGDELGAMDAADDDDEAPAPAKDSGTSLEDDDDDVGLGFDLDGGSKKEKAGGKDKKKLLVIAAVIVLLLAGGGAGVWFFAPGLLPFGPGGDTMAENATAPGGEGVAAQDQAQDEAVRDIVLDKVRQYYVDNDKLGRIFVIEGVAVNGFDKSKELITVRARLLDDAENVLDSRELMAGNTLSLFQLQVFDKPDFEQALADKTGIASRNTNVDPGGEVPFMIVFYEPPDAVREFVVDVVSVKDPPGQS